MDVPSFDPVLWFGVPIGPVRILLTEVYGNLTVTGVNCLVYINDLINLIFILMGSYLSWCGMNR